MNENVNVAGPAPAEDEVIPIKRVRNILVKAGWHAEIRTGMYGQELVVNADTPYKAAMLARLLTRAVNHYYLVTWHQTSPASGKALVRFVASSSENTDASLDWLLVMRAHTLPRICRLRLESVGPSPRQVAMKLAGPYTDWHRQHSDGPVAEEVLSLVWRVMHVHDGCGPQEFGGPPFGPAWTKDEAEGVADELREVGATVTVIDEATTH